MSKRIKKIEVIETIVNKDNIIGYILKYYRIAKKLGFENEYISFLSSNDLQKQKLIKDIIKGRPVKFTNELKIHKLKVQIDKLIRIGGENFNWRFAKLKDDYELSNQYYGRNKNDILVFSYLKKGTLFGDLYAFKFLEDPKTTIVLNKDEFNYIN